MTGIRSAIWFGLGAVVFGELVKVLLFFGRPGAWIWWLAAGAALFLTIAAIVVLLTALRLCDEYEQGHVQPSRWWRSPAA